MLVGRDVDVLSTDQEWGRQCIAGMNPCTLVALSKAPAEHCGSAIGPQHVDGELGWRALRWRFGGVSELAGQGRGRCRRQGHGRID